jgi:transcriptional regulator with XRE-family HTH domain
MGQVRPPQRCGEHCDTGPMTGDAQAAELGSLLKARRMEGSPADVGLPDTGRRRVPGLRREEVVLLAAISTDYYTRIEQGRRHASEAVLDAIARVLRLNPDEREYAFELARPTLVEAGRASRPRPARQEVPAGVQALIDAMVYAPAVVHNGRLDIVGANTLGRALFADVFDREPGRPNMARFIFLDARASDFYVAWETIADAAAAILRVEAGRSPYSRALTDLIGELATRSDAFKVRWAAHHVQAHRRGIKHLRHPVVGDLTLRYEALEISGSGGLTVFGYKAEPGSASHDALKLLASWAATPDEQDAPAAETTTRSTAHHRSAARKESEH